MLKVSAAVLAAAALAMSFTGTAQAEYNPKCASGVTQIGATTVLQWRGENVASVKQFKGCNKNWAYIYVWDSWRANHKVSYWLSAGIRTRISESSVDYVKAENRKELWSSGADTLSECTQAGGAIWNDTTITVGNWTEERC
ncbi:hypothetical protein [Lentzea sp. NPDC051838]|uniref:hypothetical protein n=1 Tax=Lentzea sp. NPDC051838 TaxID=3154849 RepID=UPI0034493A3B